MELLGDRRKRVCREAANASDGEGDDHLYKEVPSNGFGQFIRSPYTLSIPHEDVEKELQMIHREVLDPFEAEKGFPWLLVKPATCFENYKCAKIYRDTVGSPYDKLDAMVDYMNIYWCQIVDDEKPTLIKKIWDGERFVLVRRTQPEFILELADTGIQVSDDDDGDDRDEDFFRAMGLGSVRRRRAPSKPINPGRLWLNSFRRLRYSRIRFDPAKFDRVMGLIYGGDADTLNAQREGDKDLNLFTGMKADRRTVARFVSKAERSGAWPLLGPELNVRNCPYQHLGFLRAYFVDDRNSPQALIDKYGLGAVLTQYDAAGLDPTDLWSNYLLGPPHPSNPLWPQHREMLLKTARTIKGAEVFIGGDPDAPDEVQDRELRKYFGRLGDPWGDCGFSLAPWLEFVFVGVCSRKWDLFEYVVSWCSTVLNDLGSPRSISMDLYHKQNGGGKSMFCMIMCALIGEHWIWKSSEPDDILGNFTAAVENKLLVFLDEITISKNAGSKQINTLKNLLTDTQVKIHAKYKEMKLDKKWLSLMTTSNVEGFVTADQGERRHCFVEINSGVCGKRLYLSAIYNMMHGDGRFFPTTGQKKQDDYKLGLGMIYWRDYLSNWDTSTWSEWPVPTTKLLKNCQVTGMNPLNKWWYSRLQSESLSPSPSVEAQWPVETPRVQNDRNDLIRQHAFRRTGPSLGYESTEQEYVSLLNARDVMGSILTEEQQERVNHLEALIQQSRDWNPLWPIGLLLDQCLEDMRSKGGFGLPTYHQLMNHLKDWINCGKPLPKHRRQVVSTNPGFDSTAVHVGSSYPGQCAPGALPASGNQLPPPTKTVISRINYVILPDVETAKGLFATSQQWASFDQEETNITTTDSNQGQDKQPWDLMESLSTLWKERETLQKLIKDSDDWVAEVRRKKDSEENARLGLLDDPFASESENESVPSTPIGGFLLE